MNRKVDDLSKIKPELNNNYSGNYNLYIFDNPIHEHWITSYMEET
jgi:hypothetical protein